MIGDHTVYLWLAYSLTCLGLSFFWIASLIRFYRAKRLLDRYQAQLSPEKGVDLSPSEKEK